MSINELVNVLRPPGSPSKTGSYREWGFIEKKMGVKLPNDYEQFILNGMTTCL